MITQVPPLRNVGSSGLVERGDVEQRRADQRDLVAGDVDVDDQVDAL